MCVPVPVPGRDTSLLRRALQLEAGARRRARWLRSAAINAAVLLALAADLSCKCAGYTSPLHWVELCCAGVAAANLLRLAAALLSAAPASLLGPAVCARTDDSFQAEQSFASSPRSASSASSMSRSADELSLSLSPRRSWRASPPPSPPSPPACVASPRPTHDRFIADRRSLADYLQQYEEQQRPPPPPPAPQRVPPPPLYQLAEVGGEAGAGGGDDTAAADALAAAWARLHLDPRRLTQFNLNLRLWLHVTILSRLVREMSAVDAALTRLGLGLGAVLGELPPDRLRVIARAPHAPPALPQLLPFLEPFPDQRYVVRRIRELAAGPCLSEYRWSRGGAGWTDSDPADAELVLHLLAAYLDAQLPAAAPGLRPFSAAHLSAAPAPPARPLGIHKVSARPPHYVLALGSETLELSRGRNNLLHSVLVFLAAAARGDPPALRRLHLGPAGLNMLWIIGR